MARKTEVVWGQFTVELDPPAKDDKAQPTNVKQWLQWLAGELACCMSQGVYVGIAVSSLGDLAITVVNDGNREKLYLEAKEAIGEQTSQLREAMGAVTRRGGRRNR
jgi:hypothetical protein